MCVCVCLQGAAALFITAGPLCLGLLLYGASPVDQSIRYKTLEMRQTLETTTGRMGGGGGAGEGGADGAGGGEHKVDSYVALQIFPHVQRQFQILVDDVDAISKTIMGYLQEYQLAFGE